MGYIQVTRKNFRGPHRDPIAVEVQESAGYDGLTLHTSAGDAVNRKGRPVFSTAEEAVTARGEDPIAWMHLGLR